MNMLNIYKAAYTCTLIIPTMILCGFPVQDYFKRRMSSLIWISTLRLVAFLIFAVLVSHVFAFLPTKFIISICGGFYFFYTYRKEVELPLNKALFLFLTTFMISCFSRIFATTVDIFLHPERTYQDVSIEAYILQLLFLIMADVVLYIPFTKYLGWLIAHFHSKPVWDYICVLPALCILVTYILIPHDYSLMYIGRALPMYLCVNIFLFLLIPILYTLFYQFVHTYMEKEKLAYSNQILSIQGTQYQQLLRSVQENSRIRHDFRHQLIVLSELLSQKNYDELESYMSSYIQSTKTELKIYSDSPALNAILSYYSTLCQDKGIKLELSLKMPPRLPISDQDLCVMLGNLLENAVYGCEDAKSPYIQLKIMQTAPNALAVKIQNPYTGTLKNVNGAYLSSRHIGFGQGLESVRIIAEKHHGCIEVQSDQQIFTVKVLLQLL